MPDFDDIDLDNVNLELAEFVRETHHRADAVLAASKAVNSILRKKLGRRDISEVKLFQEAFS